MTFFENTASSRLSVEIVTAMPFNRIMCGVDFSADSVAALRVAAELARLYCAPLHVLHAIEPPPMARPEVEIQIVDTANAAMATLLDSERASLEGLSVTAQVTSGPAYSEIVKEAQECQADLVVLGARGVTLPEEVIIGRTAENVMKEAPRSVLIVRGRARE
jgi:nucleotide-binding universal stress UspA family protein